MVPEGSECGGNILSPSATPFVPLTRLTWVFIFFTECHQSLLRRRLKLSLVCWDTTNCVRQLCPDIHLLVQYYCYQGQERTIYSHQQYYDFYLTHKWKKEYLIHRFLNSLVKELWEQWSWWSPKHHNILNLIEFSN